MSIFDRTRLARERLGVDRDSSEREIRKAYRNAVKLAPPDRDAAGFQAVRQAYEHLMDRCKTAEAAIWQPYPYAPRPHLPEPPEASLVPAAMDLLRDAVAMLDIDEFMPPDGDGPARGRLPMEGK